MLQSNNIFHIILLEPYVKLTVYDKIVQDVKYLTIYELQKLIQTMLFYMHFPEMIPFEVNGRKCVFHK